MTHASPPMRFLAQHILSGEWVHTDLPLVEPEITYTLSGPTQITGKLEPEITDLRDLGLAPWGTWLYAEQDNQIRAHGIIMPSTLEGEALTVEAVGFTAFASKWPFRGAFTLGNPNGQNIDPLEVVRFLWDYLQSDPRRNLGVTVDSTTSSVKIGSPQNSLDPSSGPYRLNWWESPIVGDEIDKLAQDTPFDYREKVAWNANHDQVTKHLELGYPRLGRRRTDLRFAQDENLDELVSIGEDPDVYASCVYVHGRGEGQDMVWAKAETHVDGVLPIAVTITDKTIANKDRAQKVASEELARRAKALTGRLQIDEITMPMLNEHAPLGSFDVGDEILVTADFAWVGRLDLWHRVTALTVNPDAEQMKATLRREGIA